jgi:RNA polymerase sigma factor (sigma-70 family)
VSSKAQASGLAGFFAGEWRSLVRKVRLWLSDASEWDAEDVVQEAAASLFESADLTAPIRDLSAYVYRALRNRVVDLYRARRREAVHDPAILAETLLDERADSGAILENQEVRERLFEAIEQLPARQREVFLATELEGFKYRELARQWHVPVGTLLARKHRAVQALRAALTPLREELGGNS